jgi:hypothetical protein
MFDVPTIHALTVALHEAERSGVQIEQFSKLHPGMSIADGDANSRSVNPGDVVECEITGLGRLTATVASAPAPRAAALGVGHPPTDSAEVRRVACGFDERVPAFLKDNLRGAREVKARELTGGSK